MAAAIKELPSEQQIETMRKWFYDNYQDPVHECPYESKEGGYQYIYGGPYYASDELFSEFGGVVPDDIIQTLIDELEECCIEWSGVSTVSDYDQYLLDIYAIEGHAYLNLSQSIAKLRSIVELTVDSRLEQPLLQMTYVNAITGLEAYLSELFIGEIEKEHGYFRRFVEQNPDFQKEKFVLSSIFKEQEKLQKKVKEYLIGTMWHNIAKVREMFKATFGIEFSDIAAFLIEAIHKRHDLVHRGGKTKGGAVIVVAKRDVIELIDAIKKFVDDIDFQYKELLAKN